MLTTREAAKRLGFANDACVRLLILQGKLKAKRVGARVLLISEREVAKFAEKRNLKRSENLKP